MIINRTISNRTHCLATPIYNEHALVYLERELKFERVCVSGTWRPTVGYMLGMIEAILAEFINKSTRSLYQALSAHEVFSVGPSNQDVTTIMYATGVLSTRGFV